MKPTISTKATKFKRSISPVKQIMIFADPSYVKQFGINPEDLISFAGGWVNHEAPIEMVQAYAEIVEDEKLFHLSGGYPPTIGTSACKKAIIDFEHHLYGKNELSESQIAIGLGSTQLAFDLFQVLLDPGDSIMLMDPSYCNYPTQIVSGISEIGIMRFPVLDKATWEFNEDQKIEEVKEYIYKNRPKAVLLISPDNPTSRILSDEFVKAILEAVTEIGSHLVIDFAYKELVFDMKFPEYYSWAPNENFIALRSNSKWGRGLGRRLGWVEASEDVIESLETIMGSTILSPDMLHQMAFTKYVEKAVTNNSLIPYLVKANELYQSAAAHTLQCIQAKTELQCTIPQGGLYTFVKVGLDGAKFVDEVLKKSGVLLVPGWGFGRTGINAVRICYGPLVNDHDKITLGIEKLAEYLRQQ
jgi:aspartate aminotransferase